MDWGKTKRNQLKERGYGDEIQNRLSEYEIAVLPTTQ
jgi:hypothetical protein